MIRAFLHRLYAYAMKKIKGARFTGMVVAKVPKKSFSREKYTNQQEMARRWRF